MRLRLIFSLVYLGFIALSSIAQENPITYSFFVAGHTYGQPGIDNIGLHPPFRAKFNYIRSRTEISMGFLTGDIVKRGSVEDWDEVDADLDSLPMPVYLVAGNHDMSERELFEERYGRTYHAFVEHGDLFIVLDPNLDQWNISGDQLLFLNQTVQTYASQVNKIFVFFHQMLWWSPDNRYSHLSVNSLEGRAETINFWTEIEPLFSALNQSVFMFAGDVGAGAWAADVVYDQYGNISFIASGMGEGPGDNFVVVNIHQDQTVTYDLICLLPQDFFCLGELTDYRISTSTQLIKSPEGIRVYPNPANDRLIIDNLTEEGTLLLVNGLGQISQRISCTGNPTCRMDIRNESNGIYFLQYRTKKDIITERIYIHH